MKLTERSIWFDTLSLSADITCASGLPVLIRSNVLAKFFLLAVVAIVFLVDYREVSAKGGHAGHSGGGHAAHSGNYTGHHEGHTGENHHLMYVRYFEGVHHGFRLGSYCLTDSFYYDPATGARHCWTLLVSTIRAFLQPEASALTTRG